jgi:hypothetical protein
LKDTREDDRCKFSKGKILKKAVIDSLSIGIKFFFTNLTIGNVERWPLSNHLNKIIAITRYVQVREILR